MTNQEIWQNLLLWNRFRTTFGDEKFYFEYNVLVETTQLGVFNLNPKRKQRLELIYDLHLQGWSNKQITDHLNSKNLKTLRTKKQYTTKLIWMTIHKFKNRLSRNNLSYAQEELVAELGAYLVCSKLEISNLDTKNHAAYLEAWCPMLKSDPKTLSNH